MKFTKPAIDELTKPESGAEKLYFDDEVSGFGLRVTRKGTKVFLFQYFGAAPETEKATAAGVSPALPKRVYRIKIGDYGAWTLAEARKRAKDLRRLVDAGGNPVAEERERAAAEARAAIERQAAAEAEATRNALTLRVMIDRWAEGALRDRRESYRKESVRALRSVLGAELLDKPAHAVTGADLQRILDDKGATKPTTARRVRAYARAAFGWAVKRQIVPANPCDTVIIESREVSRDRVLTAAEIGEIWRAATAIGGTAGAFFQLAVLTLQRRNEVAGMRWAEIQDDLSLWTVPKERAKNGRAHKVHLASAARQILQPMREARTSDLVLGVPPLKGDETAVVKTGFSDMKDRINAEIAAERIRAGLAGDALKINDWRMHDLRRTGVSVLAELGTAPHVADRLLNHVSGTIRGVAAVYQRYEFLPEREAAMSAWASWVMTAAAPPTQRKARTQRRPSRKPAISPGGLSPAK